MVYAVPARGIGKPDYSKEVSSGKERAGLVLAYGQTLKAFGLVFNATPSVFAWVLPAVAPGVTTHFIDNSTGLSTPFTVPVGYIMSVIAGGGSMSQDSQSLILVDGFITTSMSLIAAGQHSYENDVVGVSTGFLDPLGLTVHTIDFTVENLGGGDMVGGILLNVILEEVHPYNGY